MDQQPHGHRIHFHVNRLDLLGRERGFAPEIEQCVQRRMRGGTRGIQRDGDARLEDFPPEAEVGHRGLERAVLAVHGRQVPLGTLERVGARRESTLREPRGHHAIACGQARMKRLDDAADVLLQTARRGRGNPQRVTDGICAEPEDARRGSGGAERPDRRRAMPSALVIVPRVHDRAQSAFELEAQT